MFQSTARHQLLKLWSSVLVFWAISLFFSPVSGQDFDPINQTWDYYNYYNTFDYGSFSSWGNYGSTNWPAFSFEQPNYSSFYPTWSSSRTASYEPTTSYTNSFIKDNPTKPFLHLYTNMGNYWLLTGDISPYYGVSGQGFLPPGTSSSFPQVPYSQVPTGAGLYHYFITDSSGKVTGHVGTLNPNWLEDKSESDRYIGDDGDEQGFSFMPPWNGGACPLLK